MLTASLIDRSGFRPGLIACFLGLLLSVSSGVFAVEEEGATDVPKADAGARIKQLDSHSGTFAIVNGHTVSTQEFENAFTSLIRQKFYHGKIPEQELAAARKDVKTRLVQRIVLLEEAERRGIAPDNAQIVSTLADYDTRYSSSAAWRENRELLLSGLKQQLEELSVVAQLEQQVRNVQEPDDAEVRKFYVDNPGLFTEPEKLRLSVILLAVDPSSPATAWEATREEAQSIYKRLADGANFAETARLHSTAYADTGGDMGYLHRGMLPEIIQEQIDKYEQGKINVPLETLQGVAIVRLEDRLAAKKKEFSDVADRARDLLIRERQDRAWTGLIEKLVTAADVKFLNETPAEQREGGQK